MALSGTIYGTAGSSPGINPGRRPWVWWQVISRDVAGKRSLLRFTVGSDPLSGGTSGTFSGTLTVNGYSYSVSGPVSANVSNNILVIPDDYWTHAADGSLRLEITLSGRVSGTSGWTSTSLGGVQWVDSYETATDPVPGAPSGLTMLRIGLSTARYSWTKGSNATLTRLQLNSNGGDYSWQTTSTGLSHDVSGLGSNSARQVRVRSEGPGGNSAWVYGPTFYTKPTAPTTPTLGASRSISWTNKGAHTHGVDLQRTDNAGTTVTSYSLGVVSSWTDPVAQVPLTQYRVRTWAGEGESRGESDWSEWSASVMAASYKPPAITKLEARRCDAAGNLTETGRYVRVVSSGTASSVKNASNVETNKLTRKVGYRKRGQTSWVETAITTGGSPTSWTNTAVVIGSGLLSETDVWEIRYTALDTYSPLVAQQVTVAVSTVAFSMGDLGAAAGKAYVPGGATFQVAGQIEVADPNLIIIGGAAYQASGVWTTPLLTLSASGSTAISEEIDISHLPPIPPGWSRGYTLLNGGINGATTLAVIYGVPRLVATNGNTSSRAGTIGWQLYKN